jgi:hypothetical protein
MRVGTRARAVDGDIGKRPASVLPPHTNSPDIPYILHGDGSSGCHCCQSSKETTLTSKFSIYGIAKPV